MGKIESLKELNKIAQKPDYKTKGNWMVRHITRDMALPVSWLFLHTPITANHVTFLSLVAGFAGCIVFCFGNSSMMLLGAILLQLWYLLDHVDGQIARYKKQTSITGVYFDLWGHYVIHSFIFFGIGYGTSLYYESPHYLFMGIVVGISVIFLNLVYDIQYKAYFLKIITLKETQIRVDYGNKGKLKQKNAQRTFFTYLHKFCEVHVVMNIVTIFALISLFADFSLWKIFILAYAICVPFVAIVKNIYFILMKIPDKSFKNTFGE